MNMRKIGKLLSEPRQLAKIPEIKYWLFITILVIFVYFTLSSHDFSFLLTLSSLLQSLSILGVVIQVQSSIQGLSYNTFIIYCTIYFARLISILTYESYLPYDSTGDWLYQVIEIFNLMLSIYVANKLKKIKESQFYLVLLPSCLIFALILHPTLNRNFFTDTCWMFSMVLETFAVAPLLWKMKEYNDLENFSSHFVAAHSVSKILSFVFWVQTYHELNKAYGKYAYLSHISGYFVLVSQVGVLVFTGQFLAYYMKSAVLGTPLVLPL
ncbi:hypothetical protein SteCoe_25971 [Stentor coeruleus]|uniref:ER lumen protein-retaining receptor n=1 Tax=Stentor coeruleus TaxID=5963 RepID=A0A1R2BDX0_9CILI|nr:hypothetical protein SteCoe_25971 [Stentor coeruleus]